MDRIEPFEQEHCIIYGHNVWHYLICTTIGDFHIVEVEGKDMAIKTTVIENDNQKAEKLFQKHCNDLLKGRML